jgi:UDP-N-acetylglucosamine/UDP-N-acetylgalactosamine diphosphorylase
MLVEKLRGRVHRFNQAHLLKFVDRLDPQERKRFAMQLASIDFEQLDTLLAGQDESPDWKSLAEKASPPPAILVGDSKDTAEAKRRGEVALRSGKVAAILVAGGQGTRLGFDLPKGMFRIGPLSSRTLFEMHVDRLRAVMKRYHASIPLYIMTSPATDARTRMYFSDNDGFGLGSDQLRIFCQGTMPAVSEADGKILLNDFGDIALSPDGHGGMLQALFARGCLEDAADKGIEHFFYGQVDNPLVELCDPVLIGHHLMADSDMTTQVVRKQAPLEKVGNVVSIDGRVQIIEYSDLPESVAKQTNPDGSLRLWAGNIAVHLLKLKFLERVQRSSTGLPFHRARKAVPYINEDGERIEPKAPNALKFERFVFDLLPLAENALVVEGKACEVFSPVKNADGAPADTPTTAREAISQLHRSWLEAAGAKVAPGVTVEIHPNWALDANDVAAKLTTPIEIVDDKYFA